MSVAFHPAPGSDARDGVPHSLHSPGLNDPIRAELYGLEGLEVHARQLARSSLTADRQTSDRRLLKRLSENGQELRRAHRLIADATRRQEALSTDAEWLLDNFHIVEDSLREVTAGLPRGYYRQLPKLTAGPLAGMPRIYWLAVELIAHTDSCLDQANITHFVRAYQSALPLTIGELWAVPMMLRLGLLENLRRLSQQMLRTWAERQVVDTSVERFAADSTSDMSWVALIVQESLAESSDARLLRLLQLVREQGTDGSDALALIEKTLAARGTTANDVLQREHNRQAANQVSVGNCVTSLRLLSHLDWAEFFESASYVETILRDDPADVYVRQDMATKDRYRRAVERLARGSGRDELDVAHQAVRLASQHIAEAVGSSTDSQFASRCGHVGYYLVDEGQTELQQLLKYRAPLGSRPRSFVTSHPQWVYFGVLFAVFATIVAGALAMAGTHSDGSRALLLLAGLAVLIPASEMAVGMVHYLLTMLLSPRVLPKLESKHGIPAGCSTFVVIPSMLTQLQSGDILTERLELHYLANPDAQLRLALLTDFADSPSEHRPEDEKYLSRALDRIRDLNRRDCPNEPERFFLLHRSRRWNPVQGCWMGWERKRGKLEEFNRLLRGDTDTSYTVTSADIPDPQATRFVITLDADTRLPREAARRLVATMAHPLNRPQFDPRVGRVVKGYGVLQPRVGVTLEAASRSRFAGIMASSAGIDPYSSAVSDVYQDLFAIGSFTGKGIYDVDAFSAAVGNVFPENQVLSHDLIEGNYARCGLVTDIELVDDVPAQYRAFARREHRWVRGDWQLLPWLLPKLKLGQKPPIDAPASTAIPASLPLVERWKILDNLRRSLVPPSVLALLVLGWTVLPGSAWFWTLLALCVPALPLLLLIVASLTSLVHARPWRLQLLDIRSKLRATAGQCLLTIAMLTDQSIYLCDAIVRTLVRLFVTHRNRLEWETAAATEHRLRNVARCAALSMWPASALAAAIGATVAVVRPLSLPMAAPLIAAWLASPWLAHFISGKHVVVEKPLSSDETRQLRRIARKTWAFFETFAGKDDHWLPPDNHQEEPKEKTAHRTSPTNIGLYCLSALAAHDLGYLTLPALVDRMEKCFDTLDRLERFHGHFQNWYDTTTLQVLQPNYVSTVDSGNLLACLITLVHGLREKADRPPFELGAHSPWFAGLEDTWGLVEEEWKGRLNGTDQTPAGPSTAASRTIEQIRGHLKNRPTRLRQVPHWIENMANLVESLVSATVQWNERSSIAKGSSTLSSQSSTLRETWTTRFHELVLARQSELSELAPWLVMLPTETRVSQVVSATTGDSTEMHAGTLTKDSQSLLGRLAEPQSLRECCDFDDLIAEAESFDESDSQLHDGFAADDLVNALRTAAPVTMCDRLQRLEDRALAFTAEMNFSVLYNVERHLFSVGYNLNLGRLDTAHYDLLASESCLTSFIAVARGDAPKRHWMQLGRPLTRSGTGIALVSWGGSMFEYLMPRLLMRTPAGTLLHEGWSGAVDRQIEYGKQQRVPWGISESGFSGVDASLDYQYQSFGVPGLGLKRDLGRDLVISPYSTALALVIRPRTVLENFRHISSEGGEGSLGFYEAIDYTPDRLPSGRRTAVVRSFMSHHQGMSLVALANGLLNDVMPRRFEREPMIRATELLLEERMPRSAPIIAANHDEVVVSSVVREDMLPKSRRLTTADTPHPRTHLFSNGRYSVMLTNAGSGYSMCHGMDVTRWKEDRTRDAWGQFVYIQDLRSGIQWSAGYQPLCRSADQYEVTFSMDKAEFRRLDGNIETHLEITVSPENCAEVRRVTLTNHGSEPCELQLTSYAEIVLASRDADAAHPAFGKLFIKTEFIGSEDALLCHRRPRSETENPVWAVHVVSVDGPTTGDVEYETDREQFLGRGRTPQQPRALESGWKLTGTTGTVLDPIFSLRRRVRVEPGASISVAFSTGVAATREEALTLADQYHDVHGVTRAFDLAWAHSRVQRRHLNVSAEELHLWQRLAAHVIYAGPALCASSDAIRSNTQGQSGLWRMGISGDVPIVLALIEADDGLSLANQLLPAHAYWRSLGLSVDLVFVNENRSNYFEETQKQLTDLARASDSHDLIDKPGGVFVRKAANLRTEDLALLQSAARVVLHSNRGPLARQVDREHRPPLDPQALVRTSRSAVSGFRAAADTQIEPLQFFNGLGGFTRDGGEYVIRHYPPGNDAAALRTTQRENSQPRNANVPLAPAPWINVIANAKFGCIASDTGGGYTWSGNSQTNRLTPWTNDAVSDSPVEVLYLRDDASGEFWSITPLPLGGPGTTTRHGHGYTVYERESHGLKQELTIFVPGDDAVKVMRLRLRNRTTTARRISATFYAEWVLGTLREQAPLHVVTELDGPRQTLLARNGFRNDFAGHIAFADVSQRPRTVTADRTEFLGRNGSVFAPAALGRVGLSGRTGAALDPCAALMTSCELQPNEERDVVFILGEAPNVDEVHRVVDHYLKHDHVNKALEDVRRLWQQSKSVVQVQTPNAALDLMVNGWLLYQVMACRLWARTGFYQSGGAYGFRDQLQDVMALVYAQPAQTRDHILRAASRQFLEGDVQHWWHPPSGRGVRTRCSDDYLWLPYVVYHYVATTGDRSILDEQVSFLKSPILRPEQDEDYGLPDVTGETSTLYEHCLRAIANGAHVGLHGLPLIGTCDWNDGMNRVGAEGRGESVWNAWFQIAVLRNFAEIAQDRGDAPRADDLHAAAQRLSDSVDRNAWDGSWYRRAYFDDGTPLGSQENDECRIDSIVQSWAVISAGAPEHRAQQAMASLEEHLVRDEDGLILLFTPPFDHGPLQPGYVKGYAPGIRENGGQYSHAATWVVQATAMMGNGNRAVELFDMLNPIHRTSSAEHLARYRVEPYVVAADIYSEAPHVGRGGWTWYTGSAGWLYRVALESILGFHLRGTTLRIEPCIPASWQGYSISYRYRETTYEIHVANPRGGERGVVRTTLNGITLGTADIPLVDDRARHVVEIEMA